jgi:hypothetical protein
MASWFRYHCQKKTSASTKNPLSPLALFEVRHSPPRKKQILHVYSQLYYDTRVRSAVEKELAHLKANGQSEPILNTRRRVTKACWDREDPIFQQDVENQVADLHKDAEATYATYMEELANQDSITE